MFRLQRLKPGEGFCSRPQHGDIVTVSYSARLEDGTEVDKHEQHVFTLGDGDVIQGMLLIKLSVSVNKM